MSMVLVCLPSDALLTTPTVLLGFLLLRTWGISSGLLQESTPATPYLGHGVSSHCRPSWPWTWSSSSQPSFTGAAAAPWTWGCSTRSLPLTLGMGAMVFPVVMYECESWTVKKAERQRIDAFELWCWRRLFRVPWTAMGSNQAILKEISPEFSLEGLMLKLKLQHFGHLMRRVDSLEKTLMLGRLGAGGEGDDRGWDGWMASLTWWAWVWVNSRSLWWTGRPGVLWFMGSQRARHDWATELNLSEQMMLWKCCTQYASKFEKLSRGHRTRKCQFSFQSQRKAMLKNAQTTPLWHSFTR